MWYEYERYVREHMDEHRLHRFGHLRILIKLNWFYIVKKGNTPYLYWDVPLNVMEKKQSITQNNRIYPESIDYKREKIDTFVKKLLEYAVICFDCFDMILFCIVSNPTDLFYLLELKYKILGFRDLRMQDLKAAKEKNSEVIIDNISEIFSMDKVIALALETVRKELC